jgi:hypothetical protein
VFVEEAVDDEPLRRDALTAVAEKVAEGLIRHRPLG